MRLASLILRLIGWKVNVTVPDFPKCIICVAPHTSNLDFILGELAYASIGRKAGFLMKSSWFFFPLGYLLKSIGGVPVKRGKGSGDLTSQLISRFMVSEKLCIAITPEGTRSLTTRWHTGFLHIAYEAQIPVVLGAIDFARKEIFLNDVFTPSGNTEKDMHIIKDYYKPFIGRYPEKFSTD